MTSISDLFNRPADEFENDPNIESAWAKQTIDHMIAHFNLISSVPGSHLRLSGKDDLILQVFEQSFPDFDVENITVDSLKSEEAKVKWREFCMKFEHEVEDFNLATMLRLNVLEDYSESNTILVTKIQFLAIEIARNRSGLNDPIVAKYGNQANDSEGKEN